MEKNWISCPVQILSCSQFFDSSLQPKNSKVYWVTQPLWLKTGAVYVDTGNKKKTRGLRDCNTYGLFEILMYGVILPSNIKQLISWKGTQMYEKSNVCKKELSKSDQRIVADYPGKNAGCIMNFILSLKDWRNLSLKKRQN